MMPDYTPCEYTDCPLYGKAMNIKISAEGSGENGILLVGEAPGKTEDIEMKPFIGPAGQVLNDCLIKVGLTRKECHITNVVRCAPYLDPNKKIKMRPPKRDEWAFCKAHFFNDLRHFNPAVIVALGKTAFTFLTNNTNTMNSVRGGIFHISPDYALEKDGRAYVPEQFLRIPVIPTYHPSAFLQRGRDYAVISAIVEDLRKAAIFGTEAASNAKTTVIDMSKVKVTIVNDTHEAIMLCKRLMQGKGILSYDTETTELSPFAEGKQDIVGVCLCDEPGETFFIPIFHHSSKVDKRELQPYLKALLEKRALSGHNCHFDYLWSVIHLNLHPNFVFDTQVASVFLYGEAILHDLKSLAGRFYRIANWSASVDNKKTNLYSQPLPQVGHYGAIDAFFTYLLTQKFKPDLDNDKHLRMGYNLVMDLMRPLTHHLEILGATVDYRLVDIYMAKYQAVLDRLRDEIISLPVVNRFPSINLGSLADLKALLFSSPQGFRSEPNPDKVTGTGEPQIDDATLSYLSNAGSPELSEFCQKLRIWRGVSKYKSAFKGLLKNRKFQGHIKEGVTTSYRLTGARSGRLSATDISLQTIDGNSDVARCFIPHNDLIVSVDFSQLELRVLAAVAGEENMIRAFSEGHDLHAFTASLIYNVPIEQVTKEQRRNSKAVNFGIVYGISEFKLSKDLNISIEEAKKFIDSWFSTYPQIKNYIQKCHRFAVKHKYIEIPTGRRRYFPGMERIDPRDIETKKELGEIMRMAQNSPIQGAASDLNVYAFTQLSRYFADNNYKTFMWAIIHDSIKFDTTFAEFLDVVSRARYYMEIDTTKKYTWMQTVPLVVDFEVGVSWGDLCKLEKISPDHMKVKGIRPALDTLVSKLNKTMEIDAIFTEAKDKKGEIIKEDAPTLWEVVRGTSSKLPIYECEIEFKVPLADSTPLP